MAPVTVVSLSRHPVKGFSPEPLDMVSLQAGAHFPGDRLYAIENGPAGFDPAAPEHQPKFKFMVLMRLPALARLKTRYDDDSGVFTLWRDGAVVASGNLRTAEGRASIEGYLASAFADDLRGPPRILAAPERFRFMDSRSGFVSLLNLASVRAIAAKAGRSAIDPSRFRMNIALDGLPPWGEFDLVGKEISIGEVRLRILKRTERCAATHADPKAGIRDLDLVGLMEREFGHHDCGVYAEVVSGGTIHIGDRFIA